MGYDRKRRRSIIALWLGGVLWGLGLLMIIGLGSSPSANESSGPAPFISASQVAFCLYFLSLIFNISVYWNFRESLKILALLFFIANVLILFLSICLTVSIL